MTEVALAPDTAPRPPAVILQLLEKLGVPCHIRPDHPALAASRRVQAALLDDARAQSALTKAQKNRP